MASLAELGALSDQLPQTDLPEGMKPYINTTYEEIADWTQGELIFDGQLPVGVKFDNGELRGSNLYTGHEPGPFSKDVSGSIVVFEATESRRWLDLVDPSKPDISSWSGIESGQDSKGHVGIVNVVAINEHTAPLIREPIIRAGQVARAMQSGPSPLR